MTGVWLSKSGGGGEAWLCCICFLSGTGEHHLLFGCLLGPLSLGPALRTSDWSEEGSVSFHPVYRLLPRVERSSLRLFPGPPSSASGKGLI